MTAFFWVLLITIAAAAVGAMVLRRRHGVWRAFAARHGLRYASRPPRVRGIVDGHEVELGERDRDPSHAETASGPIELSVRLRTPPPADLRVLETGSAVRAVHALVDSAVIETGDEPFDARYTVHAGNAAEALAYLSAPRRAALLDASARDDADFVSLRRGAIALDARELLGGVEKLDEVLQRLLTCAIRLDGAKSSHETASAPRRMRA